MSSTNKLSDFEIVRGYVIGDGKDVPVGKAPEGNVRLEITHSVLTGESISSSNFKNFLLDTKIKDFKEKLYRFVGTEPKYMELILRDESKVNEICKLEDDEKTLEFYEPKDGMNIHVIDKDPNNFVSYLQDISKAPKPVISEEDYNKREGTYKKWKEEQLKKDLENVNNNNNNNNNINSNDATDNEIEIKVGDRCKVVSDDPTNYDERLGKVQFVGTVEFSSGVWVGVELDLPLGKNDGSVKGKKYFQCTQKYGCFAKPKNVLVGDYPEEEI
ncbi:hypothetical protein RB653_004761 [Dictyostelium firmibasis]|uniref:CAP-Gly domain-containing protein n=1 Tax=Dictyostelium firmibasis TaxID=79012 RepID=A0AAN7UB32_9MYCE